MVLFMGWCGTFGSTEKTDYWEWGSLWGIKNAASYFLCFLICWGMKKVDSKFLQFLAPPYPPRDKELYSLKSWTKLYFSYHEGLLLHIHLVTAMRRINDTLGDSWPSLPSEVSYLVFNCPLSHAGAPAIMSKKEMWTQESVFQRRFTLLTSQTADCGVLE